MSKARTKHQAKSGRGEPKAGAGIQLLYESACRNAEQGQRQEALRLYEALAKTVEEPRLKALLCNDRGALAALEGAFPSARQGFQEALALDPDCESARANLALLTEDLPIYEEPDPPTAVPIRAAVPVATKVAVLSFLFNWPSTGGGNVHTAELVRFLAKAGYEVRHFYPRYPPWSIGRVDKLPIPSEALEFDDATWNVRAIQDRFRRAVSAFGPDHVIIQDAWNFKPHLAEAMSDYSCYLRFQALECLCPLNNVRLLPGPHGRFAQCSLNQLATPDDCRACISERGHLSGALHRAERALSGVGTAEYDATLRRALRQAEAVLVLNPATEAMVSPYARRVRVVPWGMDPARFPWPPPTQAQKEGRPVTRIFIAALVEECMKGFHVLHEACSRLWKKRRDFELVATGEPARQVDAFTRFTGWASQEELPRHYWETDITVVPTIAQEGLSRTSVEAMAAGKPVVASRIGGLPATVVDGVTGLLCEPGDTEDLARKLEVLLDDADLQRTMGFAGRRRFEKCFAWDVVIDQHYRPLLQKKSVSRGY
jgi:glycosyltransferase involved in cell wall biosynthesis